MPPKKTSPTDFWDAIAAYSNPVPYDVLASLEELGLEVVRTLSKADSSELVTLCPAHEDRKPSFSVNDTTGLFNCFSCGYAGQFVQLVEDVLELSQTEAFTWITRQGLYALRDDEERPGREEAEEIRISEAHLALFTEPPREALERRGLSAAACRAYGVVWDCAKGAWIIPIREPGTGRLIGWQSKGEYKRSFFNYPGGVKKSRCVFGIDLLSGLDEAVLLESPLDAVRLASLGVSGGVAAYGAYVSEFQMRLIKVRVRRVIMGLDNDKAGRAASEGLHVKWRRRGLPMKFLNYDGIAAKDVGDMSAEDALRSVRTARYAWQRRVAA
jgi:DNA primase